MKTIECEITGETPLLVHSAAGMAMPGAKKNPTKHYDPTIDAEKVAYRTEKGDLFVPGRCIKACFINGASWRKFGNKSAKPIVAGCTRIEPYEVLLTNHKGKVLKKYEIDIRPVVVQKARIMRSRPRIDEWKLKFNIVYNDEIIGDAEVLKEIMEEAGQRIGLLDNRPQRYGENGTFKLTGWKPKK